MRYLLPKLHDIVEHHLRGTRFGIGVDPADGLLSQGAEGYQLTWMDAKVGDWVVTPRRGKAVEINALWYNALRIMEGWVRQEEGDAAAAPLAEHAERVLRLVQSPVLVRTGALPVRRNRRARRQARFLAAAQSGVRHLARLSGTRCRSRWQAVLEVVRTRLLTPVGLRSLAPGEPDYKEKYFGDLRARDAAYHQGTVWAWLIGPFVDAWVRAYPEDRVGAATLLDGFRAHLAEACVGSISEIFDAEPPFTPRGCIAQAWSVAEVLRCLVKMAS